MISFEPNTNSFHHEVLKPINEANYQMYFDYDKEINRLVNEAKQKGRFEEKNYLI